MRVLMRVEKREFAREFFNSHGHVNFYVPVKQEQDSRGVDESWLDFTLQTNKNSHSNLNQLKVDESTRDSMAVCSQMRARIATVINPRAKPVSLILV
jgi:hypothetical protein